MNRRQFFKRAAAIPVAVAAVPKIDLVPSAPTPAPMFDWNGYSVTWMLSTSAMPSTGDGIPTSMTDKQREALGVDADDDEGRCDGCGFRYCECDEY